MASIINASSTGSGGIVQTADASGVLQLQSNGTAALTVDTSANIGIGTTAPTQKLNVRGGRSVFQANSDFYSIQIEGGAGGGQRYIGATNEALPSMVFSNSGGTEQMRISSAGYVTQPYQPAFYAYMSAGGSTLFTSGANFVFDTVSVNTGSNYSTSTGRFTAPVAGWYHFSTTVLGQAISAGTVWEIGLTNQSGGLGALGGRMVYQSNYTGAGGYIWGCASCTFYLNVGDYMRVTNNSGASAYINSGPWACFSGHLIG